MVYAWKVPGLYSVPAQAAGNELDRIYGERGRLDASDIVDASRPETAVLHPCFEWRDEVAAEEYRKEQARHICRCIVRVQEGDKAEAVKVRAYFHAQDSYHPTQVIIQDTDKYSDLCKSALRELKAVREKYMALTDIEALKAIFDAINDLKEETICNNKNSIHQGWNGAQFSEEART